MTIEKEVTIGLKMDSTFVRLLNANIQLSGLKDKDELDPVHQLALLVLVEARGGLEAEVWSTVLPAWRPHLDVVSEMRKVVEEKVA